MNMRMRLILLRRTNLRGAGGRGGGEGIKKRFTFKDQISAMLQLSLVKRIDCFPKQKLNQYFRPKSGNDYRPPNGQELQLARLNHAIELHETDQISGSLR
jgi:hypothetical protein